MAVDKNSTVNIKKRKPPRKWEFERPCSAAANQAITIEEYSLSGGRVLWNRGHIYIKNDKNMITKTINRSISDGHTFKVHCPNRTFTDEKDMLKPWRLPEQMTYIIYEPIADICTCNYQILLCHYHP